MLHTICFLIAGSILFPPSSHAGTDRFSVRSYVAGGDRVWVGASKDHLVVRTASPDLDPAAIARLVENAAAKLPPSHRTPLVAAAARKLQPHGLFLVELAESVRTETLSALADGVAHTEAIVQAYPVLTRASGRAFADDRLVVRAETGQLQSLLAKLLPQLDAQLVRYSRLPDTALIEVGKVFAHDAIDTSRWLAVAGITDLKWAEPQLYREAEFTAQVDDPLAATQWHLWRSDDSIPGTGEIFADEAWDTTLGDPSVVIAIFDSGTDLSHEDLAPNIIGGFDAVDNDEDPSANCSPSHDGNDEAPSCPVDAPYRESHGTACSGLAASRGNNGIGTSGVCPLCSLMPVRLLGTSDSVLASLTTADAFVRAVDDGAWVINNSWGPGISRYFPLSESERTAIDYAHTSGRDGKGTVIVFAAGNDTADVSMDAYARGANVIAVAATTNLDDWAYYSNWGDEIDVAAPSLGGAVAGDGYGIVTTDLSGEEGYDTGNYFTGFSGTSASSPIVAGLAGLVLSANPDLTADQVRIVLTSTADKVRADKVDWQEIIDEDIETAWEYDDTGHSRGFGYGRINAGAAVTSALTPPLQGGSCDLPCQHCDTTNRCQMDCVSQADCPDGSICNGDLCEAPAPKPTDIGEPCSSDCDYCVSAIDSQFSATSVCTNVCGSDADCPGGFSCNAVDPDGPLLCTLSKATAGAPNDFGACMDHTFYASILVIGDGQEYCSDICIKDAADTCPYGFHCNNARCACTDQHSSGWCIEYTCSEALPAMADWPIDLCFPDDGWGSVCTTNRDCPLGDYCNQDGTCRIDDREGCLACMTCVEDTDCGPRGRCMDRDDGNGPRCMVACDTDGSCPGNGVCGQINGRWLTYDVCLSPETPAEGETCAAEWSCEVVCRNDVFCPNGLTCNPYGRCVDLEPEPEEKPKRSKDGCAAIHMNRGISLAALLMLLAGRTVRRRRSQRM